MITMNPEVVLLSLAILLILGWCPHVQGFKCYICDSTMDSCYSSVSSKYLKDCHERAHACITSSLENQHGIDKTSKRWFQRSCLYIYDYEAFGIGVSGEGKLPQIEHGELHVQKVYQMHLANEARRKLGIEEFTLPNIHNFSENTYYSPFNRLRFCNEFDGCNNWEGEPPFPMAEGYPVHEFKERKTELSCWSCTSSSSLGKPYSGTCPDR